MSALKKKLLAIPVEIYKREFFIQLYLALLASKDDFQVLLGEQNDMSFKRVYDGIYLHKDHANWSERIYKKVKSRNNLTAAQDSEGLIYPSEDDYLSNRASKWILENIDLVFFWGSVQKKLILKVSKGNNNFHIVGSPKFDICNLFRDNHKNLNTNYKRKAKKILINTRFASTNIRSTEDELMNLINLGVLKSDKDFENYESFINSENIIYGEFLSLIQKLDSVNDVKITIRPHPVEYLSFYNELAKSFSNVIIDNHTSLHEQILDHDCIIHDGCTTAVEAKCMGKAVFGLRPGSLKNAYSDYANNYSYNFSCSKSLYDYLINTNICDYKNNVSDDFAKESIYNWSSSSINSTYQIISKLNDLKLYPQGIFNAKAIYLTDLRRIMYYLYTEFSMIKYLFKQLNISKLNRLISSQIKIENKFCNIDLKEINNLIETLNKLDRNTLRLEEIEVKKISNRAILIYKKAHICGSK